MSDRELVAQEIVEALFKDIRGRSVLKWFFDPNPDRCGPICEHFNAIDLDVQGEISAAWRKIVLSALSDRSRSEVGGEVVGLDAYDAGILSDFGGGNVEWWQDYIRAELGRAHEFYQDQIAALSDAGRLREEVTGEVVEAAAEAVARHFDIPAYIVNKSRLKDALSIAAPIIAADAERRVRDAALEEARLKAGAHSCAKYGDHDAQLLAQRVSIDIADAIGALKDKLHVG